MAANRSGLSLCQTSHGESRALDLNLGSRLSSTTSELCDWEDYVTSLNLSFSSLVK